MWEVLFQSFAASGADVTPFLLVAVVQTNAKRACYVSNQFYEVKIPIAPPISSTEVVKTSAEFGPSKTMLGSALTLRNGRRYFADPATQSHRSRESYELLRAIGVPHTEGDLLRYALAHEQTDTTVIRGRLMHVS